MRTTREEMDRLYDAIMAKIEEGKTRPEIAKDLDISVSTVGRAVQMRSGQKQKKTFFKDKQDEVIRMYEENRTLEEISEATGLSIPCIRDNMGLLGYSARGSGWKPPGDGEKAGEGKGIIDRNMDLIISLFNSGLTYQEIADAVGADRHAINKRLLSMGYRRGRGRNAQEDGKKKTMRRRQYVHRETSVEQDPVPLFMAQTEYRRARHITVRGKTWLDVSDWYM